MTKNITIFSPLEISTIITFEINFILRLSKYGVESWSPIFFSLPNPAQTPIPVALYICCAQTRKSNASMSKVENAFLVSVVFFPLLWLIELPFKKRVFYYRKITASAYQNIIGDLSGSKITWFPLSMHLDKLMYAPPAFSFNPTPLTCVFL